MAVFCSSCCAFTFSQSNSTERLSTLSCRNFRPWWTICNNAGSNGELLHIRIPANKAVESNHQSTQYNYQQILKRQSQELLAVSCFSQDPNYYLVGFNLYTVKLRKPWTEILLECYCVARKEPVRHEKTDPTATTLTSLWICCHGHNTVSNIIIFGWVTSSNNQLWILTVSLGDVDIKVCFCFIVII